MFHNLCEPHDLSFLFYISKNYRVFLFVLQGDCIQTIPIYVSFLFSKMDISPKKRTKIVTLSENTSLTQRDIAKECNVSFGAVNKILKQ